MIENLYEKNKTAFTWLVIFSVLPFLTGGLITWLLNNYHEYLPNFTTSEWIILYSIVGVCMSVGAVPNTLIAAIGGYFLGFSSLFYLSPAYMVAATFGYFIGRFVDTGNFKATLLEDPKVEQIVNKLQTKELATIIFAKISPVLPFVLMNALFGMLRYNFIKFLIGSWIGKMPRVLLFTYIGTQVKNIMEITSKGFGKELWVYAVSAGLVIASLAGVYFFILKPKSKEATN